MAREPSSSSVLARGCRQQIIIQPFFLPSLSVPSPFTSSHLPHLPQLLSFLLSASLMSFPLLTISHTKPNFPRVCLLSCHISPPAEALSQFSPLCLTSVISSSLSTIVPLCEPALRPHRDTLSVLDCSHRPVLSPGFLKWQ